MTCARILPLPLLLILSTGAAGPMVACAPPERPFLPASPDDMRAYADLIRADFEIYLSEVQLYFRCLEEERARIFVEAQEVSADYARFVDTLEQALRRQMESP